MKTLYKEDKLFNTKLLKNNFLNLKYLATYQRNKPNINDLLTLKYSLEEFKLFRYSGSMNYGKFNNFTQLRNLTLRCDQPRNISGLNVVSLKKIIISSCFESPTFTTDTDIDLVKFANKNNLSKLKELEIDGVAHIQLEFILPQLKIIMKKYKKLKIVISFL